MRYANAVGKRFLWSYEDLPIKTTGGNGKRSVRVPRAGKTPL
jgi:hypothetical protein